MGCEEREAEPLQAATSQGRQHEQHKQHKACEGASNRVRAPGSEDRKKRQIARGNVAAQAARPPQAAQACEVASNKIRLTDCRTRGGVCSIGGEEPRGTHTRTSVTKQKNVAWRTGVARGDAALGRALPARVEDDRVLVANVSVKALAYEFKMKRARLV